MKLLIGYFGPYLSVKKNISSRVIKKLKSVHCPKILFPVRFNKKIFLKPLHQYKPNIYLILAHNPKGKYLQIELRGVNLKTGMNNLSTLYPIKKGGKKYEVSCFKPRLIGKMKYSTNAGRYVCNYSIYTVLREIRVKKLKTKLCFLHIPGSFKINRASDKIKIFITKLKPHSES